MAAIYDALGNYVGDDGADAGNTPADIAKMRATLGAKLEARSPLARTKSAAMQQLEAIDAKPLSIDDIYYRLTTPLAKPVSRFESLQRDIATLPQQVSDVTNTLFGNPFQMMVRTPIEAMLRGKTSTPEINALLEKNTAPMQTRQGEEFASNVGKAFEASKLPPWPMTGGMAESIIGMPQRRALAPSDVRALSGDAARLATQLSEVVPDFQAAQTGFRRIDPVTGKPTVGSRLQSLADEWAGVLERRQSIKDEVSPFIDVASPEMYAIRRKGTRLVEPSRPETAAGSSFSVDPATSIVKTVVGSRDLTPYGLMQEWKNVIGDELPNALYDELRAYAKQRIIGMYPDLAPSDAMKAFNLEFSDKNANAAKMLEFYDEFLGSQHPSAIEGRRMAADIGAPVITPTEFMERHKEATDWLQGPFSNYVIRNVGTEGDPLVALAAQGLTYKTPEMVRELARWAEQFASQNRQMADMPEAGLVYPQLQAKSAELLAAQDELTAMNAQRQQILDQAEAQNIDPRTIPEYTESTNPIRIKARQVAQLEQEVENLKTGAAYEALTDAAVLPRTPQEILQRDIQSHEQPFYPSVTRAAPNEKLFVARNQMIRDDVGFGQIAKDFYRDVIEGKIPTDQLKNLTVEKYVRKGAEKRIAKEAEEARIAEREKTAIADAAKQQLDLAQIYLDNSSVIELTDAMSPADIAKVISMDTAVLDHCVGQCGQAAEGMRNPFTGERQSYYPIYDFARESFGRGDPSKFTYVRSVLDGSKMLSTIRDKQTGLPAATIDFSKSLNGTYAIGYVSGARNGEINPTYSADIAKYLNQYADRITSVSDNLKTNAGVFDTTDASRYRDLVNRAKRDLGVSTDEIRNVDPLELPRFITQGQFNEYIRDNMPAPIDELGAQGNIARIQNESRLRERYAELDRLADITQRYIDELETDRTTRGLSPEGEQRLQQLRNNLEEYINEQIAIDAELNPPQDWEPDPTHPANAPIDDLQLFQDLRQPEPRTYEQLLADANSIVDTINRINERIAAATTPEQHTELINARSVYHNTLREINGQMEALQQQQMQQNPRAQAHLDELDAEYAQVVTRLDQLNQADREGIMPVDHALLNDLREQAGILRRAREELRNQIFGPQQLPAPPAEVRLQPEQVPVTLLNNDALAARMTNDMLADATPMVEHLREQIQEFRRDGEGPDAIRGFLEEVRDNAELYFGEADPYVVEYAIRVAEGSWRPGFAKGGHVRIAKTIPAMRAELRRT